MRASAKLIGRFGGGTIPDLNRIRCSGRDIGSSRSAEDGATSEAAGALTQVNYSTFPLESYPSRPVKNYRQHPAYKSAASGLRFPFTPRALSGWYVPSPDHLNRFWVYLNGRNAEYSAHLRSSIARPVLKPDREEKGLGLLRRLIIMDFVVRRCLTKQERIYAAEFINANHSYIKFSDRPSRKMYWLLFEDLEIVGVFALGSAFARPKAIAEWMKQHQIKFNELANNIVYCLSGHKDRNAGSRFLKLLRNDAKIWWRERYGDELKAFQTFILPPRTGAIYKADNWIQLGETTGGKSMSIRTLKKIDGENNPAAERREFKSGEVKYLVREFKETTPKLIFVKLAA